MILRHLFEQNIEEIKRHPSLIAYGVALSACHLLTFILWSVYDFRLMSFFHEEGRMCWPFFSNCEILPLNYTGTLILLTIYLGLAAASGYFFLTRHVRHGYFTLLAATLIKALYYFSDYRLMGNYHYMQMWSFFVFFFLPDKIRTQTYLIVLFYLAAGSLKFNLEWLSGAALLRDTFLTGKGLEAACLYVVVLETVLVFGLLSSSKMIFWLTFAQFVLFHAFSYLVVGFYYPSIMACLLTLFLFIRYFQEEPRRFRLSPVPAVYLLLFVVFNLLPKMVSDRPDLDGQGRWLALNMLDAKAQCDVHTIARFEGNKRREFPRRQSYAIRIHCDPLIVLSEARFLCRELSNEKGFIDLDVAMVSRRYTDTEFQKIFEYHDFCRHPRGLNFWGFLDAS